MKRGHSIMIVDDEPNMRALLLDLLVGHYSMIDAAEDGEKALKSVRERAPAVMLLDLRLAGMSGMEVLRTLRAEGYGFPVIIITAYGDVGTAVAALKNGAADFIVKPFDNERLLAAVAQALEAEGVVETAGRSRPELRGEMQMIGDSAEIRDVFALIEKVAATEAGVLIRGESGTGKELVARAIHLKSPRRERPLVSLNCAALPETLLESELFGYERGAFTGAHAAKPGKLELADGGTLFLDEVADLSASAQAKLLRVLEDQTFARLGGTTAVKVDVRLIAATNRDLEAMVRDGEFRKDLYFRLDVVEIFLPPLRERKEDIPALAEYFLGKYADRHRKPEAALTAKQMERLTAHVWPGNIRELEHALEKFVILGELPLARGEVKPREPLTSETVSAAPGAEKPEGVLPLKEALDAAEREIIIHALTCVNGNKAEAARLLAISYKTLFNKIHQLGISFRTEIE